MVSPFGEAKVRCHAFSDSVVVVRVLIFYLSLYFF